MKLNLTLLSELLKKLEGKHELVSFTFYHGGGGAIVRSVFGHSGDVDIFYWDSLEEFEKETKRLGLWTEGLLTE